MFHVTLHVDIQLFLLGRLADPSEGTYQYVLHQIDAFLPELHDALVHLVFCVVTGEFVLLHETVTKHLQPGELPLLFPLWQSVLRPTGEDFAERFLEHTAVLGDALALLVSRDEVEYCVLNDGLQGGVDIEVVHVE